VDVKIRSVLPTKSQSVEGNLQKMRVRATAELVQNSQEPIVYLDSAHRTDARHSAGPE
jgi:hypothetical protein